MGENSIIITTSQGKEESKQCSKRTLIEIFMGITIAGIIFYFMFNTYGLNQENCITETNICEEPSCQQFALELNDFLDLSVNPCDDFHQFVCGNFYESAVIKQINDPMSMKMDYVKNELDSYITAPIMVTDSYAVLLQKAFFRSCLNLKAMDEDENKTFLKLIDEIGGWPMLEGSDWKKDEFDWKSTMTTSRNLGLPFQWFLKLDIYVNNDTNYLQISCPDVTTDNQDNKEYMKQLVKSVNEKATIFPAEIEKVLKFQKKLASIAEKCTHEPELASVQQLYEIVPNYEWLSFLNNITEETLEITENTTIAFNIHYYIYELDKLMMVTENRTIANYIMWTTTQYFAPFLSNSIRETHDYFTSNSKEISRFNKCVLSTQALFYYVSETEFIRKHTNKEIKASVKKMANEIKEEMQRRIESAWIENVSWLNNASSQRFLNIVKEVAIDVGGQEEIFDQIIFDNNYLHIDGLRFNSNNSNIIQMITERRKVYYDSMLNSVGKIGIIRDNIELYFENFENVKYFTEQNRISKCYRKSSLQFKLVVPSSLLYGFFYENNRPKYLNYGGLGSLIAEELVRGFLQQLKEDDRNIWSHTDYKVHENGTECFEKDFYSLQEEISSNATSLIQMIISDVIGRNLVYSVYKKWVDKNEKELLLPNLPYNANQLFWITSSLVNCQKLPTEENARKSELIIPRFRNILSLRHSPYFADDFNCSTGSFMNPKKPSKCWLFL